MFGEAYIAMKHRVLTARSCHVCSMAHHRFSQNALVRWCTTMFGEAYIAWVHTKALRLFVESVLRYGLPVNFVPILLKPKAKTYAKLRSTLSTTYAPLDANASQGDVEIPSMAIANEIGAYY